MEFGVFRLWCRVEIQLEGRLSVQRFLKSGKLSEDPLYLKLIPALSSPTGVSSSGFAFLQAEAWLYFRDRVPHVLGGGHQVFKRLQAVEDLLENSGDEQLSEEECFHLGQSVRVLKQVVRTASITAPPALWLASFVIQGIRDVGVADQLLEGQSVLSTGMESLHEGELEIDLCFLSILGILERSQEGYSVVSERGRRIVSRCRIPELGSNAAEFWGAALMGHAIDESLVERAHRDLEAIPVRVDWEQEGHFPVLEELELATLLLPVVLGLSISGRLDGLAENAPVTVESLIPNRPRLSGKLLDVLAAAGLVEDGRVTPIGTRVFSRGPGPFGIIEAYHPYLEVLASIIEKGRGQVHLTRAANVAASQRANATSFKKANDALDLFCEDSGFRYSVFIEHALGKGEAVRQRWSRQSEGVTFVGADLENEAVDAAVAEQDAGRLPPSMHFVRDADIGKPHILLDALRARGIDSNGAVMMVGNGFHEVRNQTDLTIQQVFEGYCRAGIVLLFTEETALSIGDQIETAWNTYHPAFRYTHEKSGQGLRPAEESPNTRVGEDIPKGWIACAESGGYVCLEAYCRRGRTIFPFPGPNGRNPTTNVTYFFVPRGLAESLSLLS